MRTVGVADLDAIDEVACAHVDARNPLRGHKLLMRRLHEAEYQSQRVGLERGSAARRAQPRVAGHGQGERLLAREAGHLEGALSWRFCIHSRVPDLSHPSAGGDQVIREDPSAA